MIVVASDATPSVVRLLTWDVVRRGAWDVERTANCAVVSVASKEVEMSAT